MPPQGRRIGLRLTPRQLARLQALTTGHPLHAIAKGLLLSGLDVVRLRAELAAARARAAQREQEVAA